MYNLKNYLYRKNLFEIYKKEFQEKISGREKIPKFKIFVAVKEFLIDILVVLHAIFHSLISCFFSVMNLNFEIVENIQKAVAEYNYMCK